MAGTPARAVPMVILSFPTVNCVLLPGASGISEPTVCWPLPEVLAGLAAAGFSHVGIDNFSVQHHIDRGGARGDIPALLRQEGLACSEVGVLRIGDRAVSLAAAADLAGLAAAVGASACTTAMDVAATSEAVETVRRCAEVLGEHGVRLALEFLPYSPLPSLAAAREICQRVGWHRCGLLIDSWMFFHGPDSLADLERTSAAEIALVQFSDAPDAVSDDLSFESRHRRALPGQGRLGLSRFADTIVCSGFAGVVSVEVLNDDFGALPPAEQGRLALAAAGRFWPA